MQMKIIYHAVYHYKYRFIKANLHARIRLFDIACTHICLKQKGIRISCETVWIADILHDGNNLVVLSLLKFDHRLKYNRVPAQATVPGIAVDPCTEFKNLF